MTRRRALGGLLGPAAFIAAWAILGARTDGYSPVPDPISRLAAVGADTRAPMTAGFLAFAVGVGLLGIELRRTPLERAGATALLAAAASAGVAATPLDSALGGAPHALAAGTVYAAVAATPLLAAGPLAGRGRRGAAAVSVGIGVATSALLLASLLDEPRTGLWQRLGLTAGDTWLMAAGATLALRRSAEDF